MNEKADERAKAITAAMCELVAANEAICRHGASREYWDVSRAKLEKAIATALRGAGAVHVDYD